MPNIKTVQHQFLQARFFCDLLMIALGAWFAYFLRFILLDAGGLLPVSKNYDARDYAYLFCGAWPLMILIFALNQLYALRDPAINLDIFKRIARAVFLGFALVITALYFLRISELYSRPVLLTAPFTILFFVVCARLALRRRIHQLRVQQRAGVTGVLIVGVSKAAQLLIRRIREHPEAGLEVRGVLAAREADAHGEFEGIAILGTPVGIRERIQQLKVRQVIFAQPQLSNQEVFDLMLECEKELVESRFVPNVLESHLTDHSFENLGGLPLFGLKQTPLQGMNLVLKQLFDKLVSSLALILGAPLYLALAVWVWFDDGFPVFYKQRRLGMDGRVFNMYKFRSMQRDAEQGSAQWTKSDDPRKTRAGAFLRKWNLDELPQLINVWRGDMSLVGPRPERPEWVEKFREEFPRYMVRHTVKSGMTGWAQVHGLRGDSDLKQRLEADLYYIENWSLWLDIKILLMTIKAWKNAY